MLLVLPAACGNQYGNMKLGETYCAFPAPISALAASDTCLYIGTEAGTVARLYTEGMRFGNPMYIDYGHIYCIREAGPGRLLVGIRNKGLKLVRVHGDDSISVITDYAISPGRLTYSPYSFLIKKGKYNDSQIIVRLILRILKTEKFRFLESADRVFLSKTGISLYNKGSSRDSFFWNLF